MPSPPPQKKQTNNNAQQSWEGGRYFVTSGTGDLYIRNVRPDDNLKKIACQTTNKISRERKLSEPVYLSVKGQYTRKLLVGWRKIGKLRTASNTNFNDFVEKMRERVEQKNHEPNSTSFTRSSAIFMLIPFYLYPPSFSSSPSLYRNINEYGADYKSETSYWHVRRSR